MSALRTLLLCVVACTVAVGCGPVEEGEAEPQHLVTQVSALYTEGVKNQWPSDHEGACQEWALKPQCSGPIWPGEENGWDPCENVCAQQGKECVPDPAYGAVKCCSDEWVCVRRTRWSCTHYDGWCSTNSWRPWWYAPQRVFVEGVGEQWTTGTNQFPWIVTCTNGETSKGNGFCWW